MNEPTTSNDNHDDDDNNNGDEEEQKLPLPEAPDCAIAGSYEEEESKEEERCKYNDEDDGGYGDKGGTGSRENTKVHKLYADRQDKTTARVSETDSEEKYAKARPFSSSETVPGTAVAVGGTIIDAPEVHDIDEYEDIEVMARSRRRRKADLDAQTNPSARAQARTRQQHEEQPASVQNSSSVDLSMMTLGQHTIVMDAMLVPDPPSPTQRIDVMEERRLEEKINRRLIATVQTAEEVEVLPERQPPPEPPTVKRRCLVSFLVVLFILVTSFALAAILLATTCIRNPNASGCADSNELEGVADENDDLLLSSPTCDQAIVIDSIPSQRSFVSKVSIPSENKVSMLQLNINGSDTASCQTVDFHEANKSFQSWFSIQGSGKPVKVTVRSLDDPKITILAFSGTCDQLSCIESAENRTKRNCSLTIPTALNTNYSFMICGDILFDFFLDVEETIPNDVCQGAEIIYPTEHGKAQGNNGSSTLTTRNTKNTVTGYHQNASTTAGLPCGIIGRSSWYTIIGTGSPMAVSTCDPANQQSDPKDDGGPLPELGTTITVLSGDCGNLRCTPHASYYTSVWTDGTGETKVLGNQVTWPTNIGERYFLVASDGWDGQIDSDSESQDTTEYILNAWQTVANDVCQTSQRIELRNGVARITGSNMNASSGDIIPTCDPYKNSAVLSSTNTAGTWWKVQGTGSTIRASVCSKVSEMVRVFTGLCGQLECLPDGQVFHRSSALPSACEPGLQHYEVAWISDLNQTYSLLVSQGQSTPLRPEPPAADIDDGTSLSTAQNYDFGMTIKAVPLNDICEAAIHIPTDETGMIYDSTRRATIPTEFKDSCGGASSVTAPGVWYSVIGDGSFLHGHTCGDFQSTWWVDSLATRITVLTGSCDALECVHGNDQSCGDHSSVTWSADQGEIYYILVHGVGFDTGNFNLSVVQNNITANDFCVGAIGPLEIGSSHSSNTNDATHDSMDACGGFISSAPGVWFKLEGNGSNLIAATCGSTTNYESRIIVFKGSDCNDLKCMAANYDFCEYGIFGVSTLHGFVKFEAEEGTSYYLLIHGADGQTGDFTLRLAETIVNDQCIAAQTLIPGENPTEASTYPGLVNTNRQCTHLIDTAMRASPTIWYKVTATRKTRLAVKACPTQEYFNVRITVYQGTCDKLECLAGNWGKKSREKPLCPSEYQENWEAYTYLTWSAEADQTVFIAVSGFGGKDDHGSFRLSIDEVSVDRNDECITASNITLNQRVHGSFQQIDQDDLASECAPPADYGLWYSVQGTGKVLTASTCAEELFSRSSITIFTGNCTSKDCVLVTERRVCGLNDKVSWVSQVNTTYFVFVGTDDIVGNGDTFTLMVTDDNDANPISIPYDHCVDGAMMFPANVGSDAPNWVELSTALASMDKDSDDRACGDHIPTTGGIWIKVVGNGGILRLDTQSPVVMRRDRNRPKVKVYTGLCEALSCIHGSTQKHDASTSFALWFAEDSVEYHIFIYDSFPSVALQLTSIGDDVATSCDGEFITIKEDDSTVSTTYHPRNDDPALSSDTFADPCNTVTITSRGAWFLFIGTGDRVRASTSSPITYTDTFIRVYEGEDCTSLTCPKATYGIDGTFASTDTEHHTFIDWTADAGSIYRIFVFGADDVPGIFELKLIHRENQDVCEGAEILVPGSNERLVSVGILQPDTTATTCDPSDETKSSSGGIWYKVIGTGKDMVVSTCDSISLDYEDSHVSVFAGGCDALECVAFNDDYCQNNGQVAWQTSLNEQYYILVRAYVKNEGIVGLLDYGIDLSETRGHETCQMSAQEPLQLKTTFTTRLSASSLGDNMPVCENSVGGDGVWFTVVGTGSLIAASTCGRDTHFNSSLVVYVGDSCDDLQCVSNTIRSSCAAWLEEGNIRLYPGSGRGDLLRQGSISWQSDWGRLYRVFVSGEFPPNVSGDDKLASIKIAEVAENDACENSVNVVSGDSISGSTDIATVDDVGICKNAAYQQPIVPAEDPGLWYKISFDDPIHQQIGVSIIRLRFCAQRIGSLITLFTGDSCQSLVCADTKRAGFFTPCQTLELTRELGSDFFILIHSMSDKSGPFELFVTREAL